MRQGREVNRQDWTQLINWKFRTYTIRQYNRPGNHPADVYLSPNHESV